MIEAFAGKTHLGPELGEALWDEFRHRYNVRASISHRDSVRGFGI